MPRYYEAETIAGLIKAYTMGDEFKRMAMLESLSNSQTADVVEVKHGEWKVAMLDHESMGCRPKVHYCSVCNHITTFRTFFCPNCGADMRGGTDG